MSYSTVLIKLVSVMLVIKAATLQHIGACSFERDEKGNTWDIRPVPSERPGHFNDVGMTESDWITV